MSRLNRIENDIRSKSLRRQMVRASWWPSSIFWPVTKMIKGTFLITSAWYGKNYKNGYLKFIPARAYKKLLVIFFWKIWTNISWVLKYETHICYSARHRRLKITEWRQVLPYNKRLMIIIKINNNYNNKRLKIIVFK